MTMIVELSSVGSEPRPVEASFSPAGIDLDDAGTLTQDVVLTGEIFSDARGVHLKGKITAEVEVACARCLEPVRSRVEVEFEVVFVDAASESDADEAEVDGDALDESLVEDGSVDLAEVVREQIILALPEQTFCTEDCRGLCPKCGGNRNLIDCSCESREIDPRWAALKNLN